MQYNILQIQIDDSKLREMGEDAISLQLNIEIEGRVYEEDISFTGLWDYANEKGLPEGKYFDSVRNNIVGFGPKHSKMFDTFREENFDLEPVLRSYIDECFANDGMEWLMDNRLAKIDDADLESWKDITQQFEALEESARSMSYYNLRQSELEDNLLKFVHQEVLRLFPEIFNSSPALIRKFEEVLYGYEMMGFVEKIIGLAIEANDEEE